MISQITFAADKVKETWEHLETIMPATVNEWNRILKELVINNNSTMTTVLETVYPIGSIYLSATATSPATLFGGTWTQIKDRFLLSAGDTYANGATGGEVVHTLTEAEIPAHKHVYQTGRNASLTQISQNGLFGGGTLDDASYRYYTESTGGGQAHNNMPPYLAVYVWKRTA